MRITLDINGLEAPTTTTSSAVSPDQATPEPSDGGAAPSGSAEAGVDSAQPDAGAPPQWLLDAVAAAEAQGVQTGPSAEQGSADTADPVSGSDAGAGPTVDADPSDYESDPTTHATPDSTRST